MSVHTASSRDSLNAFLNTLAKGKTLYVNKNGKLDCTQTSMQNLHVKLAGVAQGVGRPLSKTTSLRYVELKLMEAFTFHGAHIQNEDLPKITEIAKKVGLVLNNTRSIENHFHLRLVVGALYNRIQGKSTHSGRDMSKIIDQFKEAHRLTWVPSIVIPEDSSYPDNNDDLSESGNESAGADTGAKDTGTEAEPDDSLPQKEVVEDITSVPTDTTTVILTVPSGASDICTSGDTITTDVIVENLTDIHVPQHQTTTEIITTLSECATKQESVISDVEAVKPATQSSKKWYHRRLSVQHIALGAIGTVVAATAAVYAYQSLFSLPLKDPVAASAVWHSNCTRHDYFPPVVINQNLGQCAGDFARYVSKFQKSISSAPQCQVPMTAVGFLAQESMPTTAFGYMLRQGLGQVVSFPAVPSIANITKILCVSEILKFIFTHQNNNVPDSFSHGQNGPHNRLANPSLPLPKFQETIDVSLTSVAKVEPAKLVPVTETCGLTRPISVDEQFSSVVGKGPEYSLAHPNLWIKVLRQNVVGSNTQLMQLPTDPLAKFSLAGHKDVHTVFPALADSTPVYKIGAEFWHKIFLANAPATNTQLMLYPKQLYRNSHSAVRTTRVLHLPTFIIAQPKDKMDPVQEPLNFSKENISAPGRPSENDVEATVVVSTVEKIIGVVCVALAALKFRLSNGSQAQERAVKPAEPVLDKMKTPSAANCKPVPNRHKPRPHHATRFSTPLVAPDNHVRQDASKRILTPREKLIAATTGSVPSKVRKARQELTKYDALQKELSELTGQISSMLNTMRSCIVGQSQPQNLLRAFEQRYSHEEGFSALTAKQLEEKIQTYITLKKEIESQIKVLTKISSKPVPVKDIRRLALQRHRSAERQSTEEQVNALRDQISGLLEKFREYSVNVQRDVHLCQSFVSEFNTFDMVEECPQAEIEGNLRSHLRLKLRIQNALMALNAPFVELRREVDKQLHSISTYFSGDEQSAVLSSLKPKFDELSEMYQSLPTAVESALVREEQMAVIRRLSVQLVVLNGRIEGRFKAMHSSASEISMAKVRELKAQIEAQIRKLRQRHADFPGSSLPLDQLERLEAMYLRSNKLSAQVKTQTAESSRPLTGNLSVATVEEVVEVYPASAHTLDSAEGTLNELVRLSQVNMLITALSQMHNPTSQKKISWGETSEVEFKTIVENDIEFSLPEFERMRSTKSTIEDQLRVLPGLKKSLKDGLETLNLWFSELEMQFMKTQEMIYVDFGVMQDMYSNFGEIEFAVSAGYENFQNNVKFLLKNYLTGQPVAKNDVLALREDLQMKESTLRNSIQALHEACNREPSSFQSSSEKEFYGEALKHHSKLWQFLDNKPIDQELFSNPHSLLARLREIGTMENFVHGLHKAIRSFEAEQAASEEFEALPSS